MRKDTLEEIKNKIVTLDYSKFRADHVSRIVDRVFFNLVHLIENPKREDVLFSNLQEGLDTLIRAAANPADKKYLEPAKKIIASVQSE